MTKWRW